MPCLAMFVCILSKVLYSICFGLAASTVRQKPSVQQMLEMFANFNDVMVMYGIWWNLA